MIEELESIFRKHADPETARGQKAYMRSRFEFFGIKTPLRRKIQSPFLRKNALPPHEKLEETVKTLWAKDEREFQYFAQEFTHKYSAAFEKKDLALLEFMISHKSWWDTVDFIASKPVGAYFMSYPGQRNEALARWIASGNIWLQRSAILFQLNYKEADFDRDYLAYIIRSLNGSDAFFINKAIGWILRQYGKSNPAWVLAFAEQTPLHPLSRREALRLIRKK